MQEYMYSLSAKYKLIPGISIFILSLFGSQTQAQVINTDRPDQTESSLVIPEGSFQIESGILMEDYDISSSIRFLLPTNLIRVNVIKGVELRLLNQVEAYRFSFNSDRTQFAFSDMEVGTKIQLFQRDESKTSVALLAHAIFPTGSFSRDRDDYNFFAKLCVTHELSEDWSLGYNLGLRFASPFEDSEVFLYSFVVAKSITDRFGMFLEGYGEVFGAQDSQEAEVIPNANAGVTYLLRDNVQLDFSFGTGLKETMNFISAGISWNISPE